MIINDNNIFINYLNIHADWNCLPQSKETLEWNFFLCFLKNSLVYPYENKREDSIIFNNFAIVCYRLLLSDASW